MDKLQEIFDLQKVLNLRIGIDTDQLTDSDREKWILNYARAMSQEIAELTDSVPWKWWAKYQKFDQQNAASLKIFMGELRDRKFAELVI